MDNLAMQESEIPDYHKDIVRKRLIEFEVNPQIAIDFDDAMHEIEKELSST